MTPPRPKKSATTKVAPKKRAGMPLLSPARQELLDAHVRFEMAQWTGERVGATIAAEVASVHAWLASVRLSDVLPVDVAAPLIARLTEELVVTEDGAELMATVVAAALDAADDHGLRVKDVLVREDVITFATSAAELEGLRTEMIGAITASTAYRRLVAHVLYRGVKAYVLTENVFARKIPGASSLVRFGQRSLNSAAPGLEKAVDTQLSTFVEANIAETLRESRRYLEETLDADIIRELTEEAWTTTANRRVAEIGEFIPADAVQAMTQELARSLTDTLASGRLTPVIEHVLARLLRDRAEDSPADLLAGLGLEADEVSATLTRLVGAALDQPEVAGHVESRIRARLTGFYLSDSPGLPD